MSEVYGGTGTKAWQVVVGCDSRMCCSVRCWARESTARTVRCLREQHPDRAAFFAQALTPDLQQWSGQVFLDKPHLLDPLRWRKAERVAVGYHGDLFRLPPDQLDRVFAVMALANWHEFRLLSKQAATVWEYLSRDPEDRLDDICHELPGSLNDTWHYPARWPLPNVRFGFSLMTQADADAALPHARALHEAGWKIWVSLEPQIGPIDLRGWEWMTWVVQGCESGTQRRPFYEEWAAYTRAWCRDKGIPYFLKQMPVDGRVVEHPHLDGRQWRELPGDRR